MHASGWLTREVDPVHTRYLLGVRREYSAGRMLTGEVKQVLIDLLSEMTQRHQEARKAVTDEVLAKFMTPRKMENLWG